MAESQKKLTDEEIRLKGTEENKKKSEEMEKTMLAQAETQNAPNATPPKLPRTGLTAEEIELLKTEENRKILKEIKKAVIAQALAQYARNAANPKHSSEKLTDEEVRLKRSEENIQRWEQVKKAFRDHIKAQSAPNATGPELSPKKLTDEEIQLKRMEENKKRSEEMKNTMLAQAETQNAPNATGPELSPKKLTYEETRLKRTEENKKRWEEMKKTMLAQAETQNAPNASSPKPSPMKKVKVSQEVDLSAARKSDQVADKPPPNNKEVVIDPLGRPRSYKRKDLLNRVYAVDEDRQYAKERAVQLQSEFAADFPSFVKPILQSHVTGGFWLGLPVHFCKTYLPNHDEYVILVDENGDEFKTKYLALKTGLSGGWRRFAIDHRLVDGDALVFQLVAPTRFKVYIIRVNQAED